MADFLCVHGGWHGGWVWDQLAPLLTAEGHRVFTPSLTGLAERAHLIDAVTGPDTHVADITTLLEFHDLEDVTLVGHSYGGMIITGAASRMPERIARLVYVDAFVPTRSGMAATDMANPERAAEMRALAARTIGPLPPNGFERWVADTGKQEFLRRKCTAHPRACFGKGVTLASDPFQVARKTFVRAAQHDPSPFQAPYARYRDDPQWEVHSIDCLHNIMMEAPEALAGILLE